MSNRFEIVGLVDQSTSKISPIYLFFFGYLVVGSTAIAWKILFLSSCCGGGVKALFGNATGFTSLLFSSASQGRKTSFSTCRD